MRKKQAELRLALTLLTLPNPLGFKSLLVLGLSLLQHSLSCFRCNAQDSANKSQSPRSIAFRCMCIVQLVQQPQSRTAVRHHIAPKAASAVLGLWPADLQRLLQKAESGTSPPAVTAQTPLSSTRKAAEDMLQAFTRITIYTSAVWLGTTNNGSRKSFRACP